MGKIFQEKGNVRSPVASNQGLILTILLILTIEMLEQYVMFAQT